MNLSLEFYNPVHKSAELIDELTDFYVCWHYNWGNSKRYDIGGNILVTEFQFSEYLKINKVTKSRCKIFDNYN